MYLLFQICLVAPSKLVRFDPLVDRNPSFVRPWLPKQSPAVACKLLLPCALGVALGHRFLDCFVFVVPAEALVPNLDPKKFILGAQRRTDCRCHRVTARPVREPGRASISRATVHRVRASTRRTEPDRQNTVGVAVGKTAEVPV